MSDTAASSKRRITIEKINALGKPRLRGIPDVVASCFALPGVYLLTHVARPGTASVAATVYGVCLSLLFLVSAIYHTFMWPLSVRHILRRFDHSMVYVLIAGSYTPFCLTVIDRDDGGYLLLAVVWTIAALGALKSFVWTSAPRALNTAIYLMMGWLIAPFAKTVYHAVGTEGFGLLMVGGLLYTVGALIYLRRWPNPSPKTFGYHEVFHVFVVAAGACHYVAIWNLLT